MAQPDPSPTPTFEHRRPTPLLALLWVGLAVVLSGCSGSPPASPTPPGLIGAAATAAALALAATPSPGATIDAGQLAPSSSPVDTGASVDPLASIDPSAAPGSPLPSPLPVEFDPALAARLQRVVDSSRARIPTPGLSIAIRLPDGSTWVGVSGDRRFSPRKPVDPDTVFSIASITKTFVTAAVMQLVAEGQLDLDDRLSRWLPDFPRAGRITIRQLLSHTSGVFNYFENPKYSARIYADTGRRWTFAEILGFVLAPYCKPGACFHYSNTNFVLLGRVVELITGMPLDKVLRKRFFEPLGLTHTVFQPGDPTPANGAHGYLMSDRGHYYDQTGKSRVLPHMSAATVAWAAGAIASTSGDLAVWASALYGGQLVGPDLLDQMLTFRPRDEYGLGTRTRIFDGRRAVGHGGSLRGYENAMWYFPREGATIVLLSNRGLYLPDRTIRMLARALFAHVAVPPPQYDPDRNTH